MSKLQNMRVLRILSIFLAVGIAAGVFFSGKKAVPGFGDMSKLQNMCVFTYFKHFPRCGYCRRRFFFREKGRSRIWGTCHIGENTVFQLFCVSGALWVTFGVPLAPSGVALAPFGVPLGSLWGALGSLWVPLARFGCPWLPLGALGLLLGAQCSPFAMPVHKIKPPGTRHRCHGCHRSGVIHCCSDPHFHTRRGLG